MADPTPRPWFRARKNQFAIDARSEDGEPTEDYRIAKLHTSPFSPAADVCEANADLIVRAVNSFDELLAACRAMVEAMAKLDPLSPARDMGILAIHTATRSQP